MKTLTKDVILSALMGLVIPGMLLQFADVVWDRALQTQQTESVEEVAASVPLPVKVRHGESLVGETDMDSYLVGVVLKEMPASFEEEALKAQSVVARTYARKAYVAGGKHGDGSVCTEASCCQAWISEEEYLRQGGAPENMEKVRAAVRSTSGQVLTYQGELIEATYFSCSGGRTEDAVSVWGTDFPYLQAVDSPGEEEAAHYEDAMVFTREEVETKLGVTLGTIVVEAVTYTDGGGVDTICLGGRYFTGTEVRSLLGLRSTAFVVSTAGDTVTITTRGYGHRVGMSQYGADAMALAGSTYEEILIHYYQGTELTQLPEEK